MWLEHGGWVGVTESPREALRSSQLKLQTENFILKLISLGRPLWLPITIKIKINLWSWFMSPLPEVTGQIISVFGQEKVKSAPDFLTSLAKVPSSSTPQERVCGPLPSAEFSHPVLTVHLPDRWSCFTQIGLCLPLASEAWMRKRENGKPAFIPSRHQIFN